MNEYTVVLLRPRYLCEETHEKYGLDIYVATVFAEGTIQALAAAQDEAYGADVKDGLHPRSGADYKLCVMLAGHSPVKLFGWQI